MTALLRVDRVAMGQRVREYRVLAGISQEDLAERAGVARSSITNIEAGRQDMPTDTLVAVVGALGVTPNDILGFGAGESLLVLVEKARAGHALALELAEAATAAHRQTLAELHEAGAQIAAVEARVRAGVAKEIEAERAKLAEIVGAVHRIHARDDERGPDGHDLYGCIGCDDGQTWPCPVVRAVSDVLAGSSRDTTPGDDLTWADVRVPEGPRWVVPDTTPEPEPWILDDSREAQEARAELNERAYWRRTTPEGS